MKRLIFTLILAVIFVVSGTAYAAKATYDDLTLSSESYWNGSSNPSAGGFYSGSIWHNNNYDTLYGSWDGFAYSNKTDTTSTGTNGQYTAYSDGGNGGGVDGSDNYGIGYVGYAGPPTMTYSTAQTVDGAYFTNNAFAYWSMTYGDSFAKQFGGASGDDADWFLLTITGFDSGDVSTGTVDFYLADYRFTDNSLDYIVDDWTWVDLSSLGTVSYLEFTLTSSDVGAWGMNTPAYFAIDNTPIPTAVLLFGSGLLGLIGIKRKRS